MARLVYADADQARSPTLENRRRRDIAFLERLRSADAAELAQMTREYMTGPEWRRIAIERAAARRQGTR